MVDLPIKYDADDLIPPVRQALTTNDTLFALPFYAESSMTYYRKDLFSKAGLVMPAEPTYSDIERFAKSLHQPEQGVNGLCLRGKPGWGGNMTYINTLVNTFGGRWFDMDWKPALDTAAWQNALTLYKHLVKNYGPADTGINSFNENKMLFAQGKCAMWIDATIAAGMLFNPELSNVAEQVGFTQAPVATTAKGSHWLWIWALAIPSSSKNKPEALEFISWATSKDYISLVAEEEGWVSIPAGTRISTYGYQQYHEAAPFARFVLNAIQTSDPMDSTLLPKPYIGIQVVDINEFPVIGNEVGYNILRALEDQISIDEALDRSQRMIYRQMRRSGYYK